MKRLSLLCLGLLLLSACSEIDHSKTSWGASDFHPRSIVVLPVSVGGHELAKELVEDLLVKSLWGTGWFDHLVVPEKVSFRMSNSPEFAKLVGDYVVKLNTLRESDKIGAKKLGIAYKANALLWVKLTKWGYGLVEGDKMAWLELQMILVETKTGDIMWEAKHRVGEDYLLVEPSLSDLCEELLSEMLTEMPH